MEIRLHAREADRLESLETYGVLESIPAEVYQSEVYQSVVLSAATACDVPMASVNLVASGRQWSLAGTGVAAMREEREFSVCSDVVAAEREIVVGDIARHPRYGWLAGGPPGSAAAAYAGVPLIVGDGLPVGALCVLDERPRRFSGRQLSRLRSLAAEVVALLELHRLTIRRHGLEHPGELADARRLRRALDNDELVLHYQPVVDLASADIVGFEALLRWEHPDLGLIPPGDFLPAIEASGMMHPVGRHVLRSALAMIDRVRRTGGYRAGCPAAELTVAVNVSGEQLRRKGLADFVLAQLAERGLPGSALIVEVTESTVIADVAGAAEELGRLRAAGVGIALDDYGTGWSGLQRLLQFPFSSLKLDHTLTRQLGSDPRIGAVVSSTAALAADLGLGIIVEGVETSEQRRMLLDSGYTRAQGWLFGRPVPAGDVPGLLGAHRTGGPVDTGAVGGAHPSLRGRLR